MSTNNPVLSEKVFSNLRSYGPTMTLDGAVFKSGLLLLIACVTAGITWVGCLGDPALMVPAMLGGFLLGFVVAMVITFKREWSPALAPVYAVLEGCVLGSVSLLYNQRIPGIAFNAAVLTLGTLGGMLLLYRLRIVRATEKFKLGMSAALVAILILYVVSAIASAFGKPITFLHDSSPLSIGISLVIVGVAALCLVLDFDLIENGAKQG
ncbi:MAG TPA: Bax inhibitor-1/YccA family protein, partial [Candidatus Limnocylindria bacterium]|nr:Bax inhibitor-1/YccA family protein [Candidatus Limnocylindria bacterium]